MSKIRRGVTIIEVLVASSLTLLLMISAETAVRYVGQATNRMRRQIEPRQQIRSFLLNLRQDLQASSYLFTPYSGTLLGVPVSVGAPGVPGTALLFAVPEDDSSDTRYTVCWVYTQARTQADSNNPTVRELVYQKFMPTKTVPADTPGALAAMFGGLVPGTRKVFDVYLPAGPPTGSDPAFAICVAPNQGGVRVMAHFRVQPPRGEVISERFDTFIALRNNG